MLARSNRTFICSVVFLDIVEYSKQSVAEQFRLKERLNALLSETLEDVAANDRIILDTGDGVAISFLGDPEDALFVCLTLRDAVGHPSPENGVPLTLRMGINLGPVKLIKDLNEQPNLIGDGMNVAQRVMSFAAPNQVLVSRSYYEVVSCQSEAYSGLFQYEGSRTDKHVREHEVYAVGEHSQELRHAFHSSHASGSGTRAGSGAARKVVGRITDSASLLNDTVRRRPRLGTAAAVVAILVVAVGLRGMRGPPETRTEKPALAATAPATAASPQPDQPAAPTPPPGKAAATKAPAKPAAPAPPKPVAAVPDKPAAPAPGTSAVAGNAGSIALSVRPWGEVYVDGKRLGEAPPLYEVKLSPGRHRIELRNPDYSPHIQTVEIKSGVRIPIKHWFQKEKVPFPWK
jgi:class 3 adenylate cyclase